MPKDGSELLTQLAAEDYCYLTTTGRVSGRPHEIEIWFGAKGSLKNPQVSVRIARHHFNGTARLVQDEQEETSARYMLAEKYQEWDEGRTLSEWARTALVVRFDLLPRESE
jgi:hypothetical protein